MTPPTDAPPREHDNPPLAARLFIGASWLLGWPLVLDGMYQRLWNAYLPLALVLRPWIGWADSLGLTPADTGWPFICLGFALIGASFGLYGRRRWGYFIGVAAGALTLAWPYLGTLLGLICLGLLALPATRRYVRPPLA